MNKFIFKMTAYPGQTRTRLGQFCAALWDSQSRPDVIQPGSEPRTVVTPLALRCSALDHCAVQLHYWEHLDWLHNRLAWKTHHPRPQRTTEGGADSPVHHRRELSSLPPSTSIPGDVRGKPKKLPKTAATGTGTPCIYFHYCVFYSYFFTLHRWEGLQSISR